MFGTADPRPRIAFLGSFGGLRPFGAELANTAFGLACQQMKQAGTLTNKQSSESAAWGWTGDSTYQQNTTNIGRKPVEITAGRSGSALSQVCQSNQHQHQQDQHDADHGPTGGGLIERGVRRFAPLCVLVKSERHIRTDCSGN